MEMVFGLILPQYIYILPLRLIPVSDSLICENKTTVTDISSYLCRNFQYLPPIIVPVPFILKIHILKTPQL